MEGLTSPRVHLLGYTGLMIAAAGAVDDLILAAGRGTWIVASQLALVVVMCVCLARGRRGMVPAVGVGALSSALSLISLDGAATWLSWLLLAMGLGVLGTWPHLAAGAGLFGLWVVGLAWVGSPFLTGGAWLFLVPVAFSLGLGLVIGHLVRGLDASRAALARVEAESAEKRAAERLLVARELHHGVARNLVLAGVQAAVLARDHPESAPTASLISQACREATADVGRLIGLLTAATGQEDAPDPTNPDVGLKDLDTVLDTQVQHLRSAGHHVEVTCTARNLPPAIVDTANRILEEAATNIVRHSGGASRCEVAVTATDQHLEVRVANTLTGDARRAIPSTRLGLAALDERVRLLHGEFSAGPAPGGRWMLSARVPLYSMFDAPPPVSSGLTPEETAELIAELRRPGVRPPPTEEVEHDRAEDTEATGRPGATDRRDAAAR